jgi:predicted nucleic acid-binding Zn finger protein
MTAKEIAKRNKKAAQLKVLQTDSEQFFVESGEGKILYAVTLGDEGNTCTCGDFAKNSKKDSKFNCKHILSVMNAIPKGEVKNGKFLEKHKPKLDPRFIIQIEGNEFCKYAGLLDLGHQKGILSIEVEPLQFPTKNNGNFAICKATVKSKTGETYIDIGDASPENCNARVAKHLCRIASTRSIARALRSYTNIGMTCLEELADLTDVIGSDQSKKTTVKKTSRKKIADKNNKSSKAKADTNKKSPAKAAKDNKSAPKAKAKQPKAEEKVEPNGKADDKGKSDQPNMSEAQKRAIYNLSRRRGISVEELEAMAKDAYGCELENLNAGDASTFIRNLQQAA